MDIESQSSTMTVEEHKELGRLKARYLKATVAHIIEDARWREYRFIESNGRLFRRNVRSMININDMKKIFYLFCFLCISSFSIAQKNKPVVNVYVADESSSVWVCLDVKTALQIASIGAIFYKDIFNAR